jgi:hypothetical protein
VAYADTQVSFKLSKRKKRFPHLAAFLTNVVELRIWNPQRVSAAIGGAIVILATPLVGIATYFATNEIVFGFIGAAAAIPVSTLIWYIIDRQLRKPKNAEEERRMAAWIHAESMLRMDKQRKLHKWMDPSMSQLLEASAFHYGRILGAVSSSFWSSPDLPPHWTSVREQALVAADQAMEELVVLAAPCMGKPETDRGSAFKEAVEDLVDGDFAIAIGGFKEATNADWTRYAHHSPNTKVAFEPARKIGDRLKKLADQIEAKSQEAVKDSGEQIMVEAAVSSIDMVLGEMSTVEEAEKELQQRTEG